VVSSSGKHIVHHQVVARVNQVLFSYDSGYINGVLNSPLFIEEVEGPICPQGRNTPNGACAISSGNTSLIVSILSAGTFFGALIAGDVSDIIGRKWTIVIGCAIYIIGKRPHCTVP
jgi:MFS family permease